MPVIVPTTKLNNGLEMPILGLGTYASVGDDGVGAIKHGIDAGYRHFDTAFIYGNEQQVGQAIREKIAEGVVKREDVFIVTKLWGHCHEPKRVETACRKSLEKLDLDYIDLYLIHFPIPFEYRNETDVWPKTKDGKQAINDDVDIVDTWRAMEKLVDLGLVRSIGLSNFNSEQVDRILSMARIKPVTNQVECSPLLNQKKLIEFLKERNITLTAYCPLAKGKAAFYDDSRVAAIAEKYNKTSAQIALRYLVQLGAIPIPKSSNKERIYQNVDVFDFKLNDDEMKIMDSFHTGERYVKMSDATHSKYWPFGIEF